MRILVRPPDIPDDPRAPAPERAPSLGLGIRVWLLRHAEVHDDWQDRAYGSLDVPLSPAGERETAELAAAFARAPLARIACSSLARARVLGEALADSTSAPLVVDPRLREVDRGTWQGLPREEFRARWGVGGLLKISPRSSDHNRKHQAKVPIASSLLSRTRRCSGSRAS
jgi:bisphosphoglycerate-dependent phosphoglycerate mutase